MFLTCPVACPVIQWALLDLSSCGFQFEAFIPAYWFLFAGTPKPRVDRTNSNPPTKATATAAAATEKAEHGKIGDKTSAVSAGSAAFPSAASPAFHAKPGLNRARTVETHAQLAHRGGGDKDRDRDKAKDAAAAAAASSNKDAASTTGGSPQQATREAKDVSLFSCCPLLFGSEMWNQRVLF